MQEQLPNRDRERLRTNIGHIRVDSREGIGTTPRTGEVEPRQEQWSRESSLDPYMEVGK